MIPIGLWLQLKILFMEQKNRAIVWDVSENDTKMGQILLCEWQIYIYLHPG